MFYVLTAYDNPFNWQSRKRNFEIFAKEVQRSGAKLVIAEVDYNHSGSQTSAWWGSWGFDYLYQAYDILWRRESLINALINQLPRGAKFGWFDADVVVVRPDWVQQVEKLLDDYPIIQPFSHAQDLDNNYMPVSGGLKPSFAYVDSVSPRLSSLFPPDVNNFGVGTGTSTGYAWCSIKEVIQGMGMLPDWAIMGSADTHLICALRNVPERSLFKGLTKEYVSTYYSWSENVSRLIKDARVVGCLPGLLLHLWHGKKDKRGYGTRLEFLRDNQYDPTIDVYKDEHGFYRFTEHGKRLQPGIIEFFKSRNEDELS